MLTAPRHNTKHLIWFEYTFKASPFVEGGSIPPAYGQSLEWNDMSFKASPFVRPPFPLARLTVKKIK